MQSLSRLLTVPQFSPVYEHVQIMIMINSKDMPCKRETVLAGDWRFHRLRCPSTRQLHHAYHQLHHVQMDHRSAGSEQCTKAAAQGSSAAAVIQCAARCMQARNLLKHILCKSCTASVVFFNIESNIWSFVNLMLYNVWFCFS